MSKYELDMANWKKDGGKREPPAKPDQPTPVRYVCDDSTTEALIALLVNQPRGLLLARDELADGSIHSTVTRLARQTLLAGLKCLEGGQSLSIERPGSKRL